MGILLQGFFKMPPNLAVPSPADGDLTIDWWWDHLARQASDLRHSGFTAIWLPPLLKTSDGDKPGSDGYGPFDDYDIGSKDQKGCGVNFRPNCEARQSLQYRRNRRTDTPCWLSSRNH
jgi:alpha-amylase